MVDQKILYTKPSITNLEKEYAADAAANGWGERCYEYITKFENLFSKHIGVKYAIATSSCTGAYHMGLHALDIGKGDEVILADINWIATLSPIIHLGAKPILVDINPNSWCIDPKEVIKNITPNTKAIIATHIYGNLCEMNELINISREKGIIIIEDSAEAIGSVYQGKKAGSMGLFSTFSFHGTKTLTTGEGGMFLTNDSDLYQKVVTLSNHGRSPKSKKQFWPEIYGYKYKMSNIQAAIGVAQLQRIDELIKKKRYILNFYKDCIEEIDGVSINKEDPGNINGCWMPNIVFEKETGVTREVAFEKFQKNNIDARVFFWPLSSLPMMSKDVAGNINPNSYDIAERSINLPSYNDITDFQLEKVLDIIKKILKK
tara:strand:+ start:909 stop:2030 length:1122 start_codon:yes stop_codon:yes gene_type:complete